MVSMGTDRPLVGLPVFKTGVGRGERPGWVRFPHAPAIFSLRSSSFDSFFRADFWKAVPVFRIDREKLLDKGGTGNYNEMTAFS